jgi:hypothetical protein
MLSGLGVADDVRIYNRVLTKAEIQRLYKIGGTMTVNRTLGSAGSDPILAEGLTGHWSFDGTSINATKALDSSGNSKHGTLTGGPSKAIGRVGQSLVFDGTNDYVSVGNAGSGVKTVSFWINATFGAPTVTNYSNTYTAAGTYSNSGGDCSDGSGSLCQWIASSTAATAGVVTVEVWGGGGGGGANAEGDANDGSGGGGGYSKDASFTVVDGTGYTFVVGAAGSAGTQGNNGGNAGTSTWNGTWVDPATCTGCTAVGGGGSHGKADSANVGGRGGNGGIGITGDTNLTGGVGGNGRDNTAGRGGGGGEAACSEGQNGGAGTNGGTTDPAPGGTEGADGAGGLACDGGDGGAGGSVNDAGDAGSAPGGGGGGSGEDGAANPTGGAGQDFVERHVRRG